MKALNIVGAVAGAIFRLVAAVAVVYVIYRGVGICYDYGVYYLTALVSLLGPAARVSAIVKNPKPVRVNIMPQSPEYGKEFSYPNESQVAAVLELKTVGVVKG